MTDAGTKATQVLPELLDLLAAGRLKPVVAERIPLLEAARAPLEVDELLLVVPGRVVDVEQPADGEHVEPGEQQLLSSQAFRMLSYIGSSAGHRLRRRPPVHPVGKGYSTLTRTEQ